MAPKTDPPRLTVAQDNEVNERERNLVEGGWDHETEPPAITDFEAFETWSHEDILKALDSADPNYINSMADSWRNVTEQGKAAHKTFADTLPAALSASWQGASGAAAAAAVRAYTEQAGHLLSSMQLVANDLDRTESVLRETKDKVPRDNPTKSTPPSAESAREAEAEARRVMRTLYQPGVQEVDSRTPRLPEPQSLGGGSAQGVGGDAGNASGTAGEPGNSAVPGSASGDGTATQAAAFNPASTSGSPTGSAQSSGGSGASSAHPSATSAGLAGSAAGALAAAPGLGASSGRSPAGSLVGSAGGLGGVGRNGAPMSGMFPPMARGRGDDEDERKGSEYLVAASNTSELVGDLPMATQPVLGE
ncbi:MAG: hypothetical protein LLG14_23265 [Nocardiaceae bacterium]|nr:hypothetical protein [Nocardiaceae bacterium]